jgi:phospholipid/cholesterol/gamma-HCH transport system substrate-binding protein
MPAARRGVSGVAPGDRQNEGEPRAEAGVRRSSVIGRIAAIGAVAIAVIAVILILLSGSSDYKVYAIFQNASQIYSGNQVDVAGTPVGSVGNVSLTPQGQARIQLDISESSYQPLRQGVIATVRNPSLTAVANRYIELRLPGGNPPPIPNGGTIPAQNTNSAVDLDTLFNTLTPDTRRSLQKVIQGSASQYRGYGPQAQQAWQYLNPAVASASVLFSELNRNTPSFTNFITQTGNLFSTIAARNTQLSSLVVNLSQTTTALANQHQALARTIQLLPPFMRLANTTFVNLRSALDDLKPLVDASKPVAPKLRKLFLQLRPLARDAVPTVRDLSQIISQPGPNNDLIDLISLGQPLQAATVGDIFVNGKQRLGAFPISTQALQQSTPELATSRPYAADLTGWFEGYSKPGGVDANGNYARVAGVVGAASFSGGGILTPILRQLNLTQIINAGDLKINQGDRCPGSMERGGVWYPQSGYPCNPSEVPTGP